MAGHSNPVLPSSARPVLFLFGVLVLFNAILSYAPLSLEWKAWIGIVGGSAILLYLSQLPPTQAKGRGTGPKTGLGGLSFWTVGVVLAAGAFIRLYKLGELSVWPMWDEGHHAFFAIDLAEKWHWQLFFSSAQYMPVYTWLQGLFFKAVEPSLYSMWLYPMLYSLLLPPLAYVLVRRALSPTLSFLYCLLLSFSFWPLFISNFANDIGPCLLWENVSFYLWFRLRRSLESEDGRAIPWAGVLGSATGIGWYISKFWLSSIPVLALAVLSLRGPGRKGELRWRSIFLAFLAVPLLPMAILILRGEYGAHIQAYLTLDAPHVTWLGHFLSSVSYVTSVFWGSLDKGHFFFGPLWGGFLNPILGAGFLIGLLELWRRRQNLGLTWVFPALLIYLGQGIFSNYLEDIRITPMMPMVLLITAFGIQGILELFHGSKGWILLCALMAFSFGMDLYHLWGPYHQWAIPSKESGLSKPPEQYRAYQILVAQSEQEGPGLILYDLVHDDSNQTLLVSTYPFNAARNPALDPSKARWTALVINESQAGLLQGRFHQARHFPLSQGLDRYYDGLDLWIIPIETGNRALFLDWAQVNRYLQILYPDIPCDVAHPDYAKPIQELLENQSIFQKDPFLQAVLWGRIADYTWDQFHWRHQDGDLFLQAAGRLVRLGQRDGRLFYRIGISKIGMGDYGSAEKYLVEAGRLDPDYQPPPDKLAWLERMERLGRTPPTGKQAVHP